MSLSKISYLPSNLDKMNLGPKNVQKGGTVMEFNHPLLVLYDLKSGILPLDETRLESWLRESNPHLQFEVVLRYTISPFYLSYRYNRYSST